MKIHFVRVALIVLPLAAFAAADQKLEFIENDRVKVGVDLNAGGAIVYVEDKALQTGNMINYHDRGREIQQSYYSGPVPYIGPNGEQPEAFWKKLGWNPIQTGDCAGNASPIRSFARPDATTMVIQTLPMLWPHRGVRAECAFTTTIRLTSNGFRYVATIENARSDRTDYGRHFQEVPAAYTNARWYKLVSYLGDDPWSAAASNLTEIVRKGDGKGWPWRTYYTPECWSALVDDRNAGIGVYNSEAYRQFSGFAGGDAAKGKPLDSRAFPTGYIAPVRYNVLDANATLSYTALFAVGGIDEIRTTFAAEAKKNPCPRSWTFTHSRLGWTHENAESTGYPLDGAYAVRLHNGANLQSPDLFLPTATVQKVALVAAAMRADGKRGKLPLTIELKPFSPADLVDYPRWNEGAVDVEAYKQEMCKRYPELSPSTVSAEIEADGTFHDVLCTIPAPMSKAFTQVTLRFPGANGDTFSLRSLALRAD